MRSLTAVCTSALLLTASAAVGQEPELPKPDPQNSVAPAATPLPEPSVPTLVPPDLLPLPTPAASAPDLQQLDQAFQDNPRDTGAADQRRRLEWRRLRNLLVNDQRLKEALAEAEAAKTDLQKRKLLRRYYEMLYARMFALASTPEMKAYLNDRKNEQLGILPQPRVRPEPPAPGLRPSPKPSVSPSPASLPSPTPQAQPPLPGLPTPLPGTG